MPVRPPAVSYAIVAAAAVASLVGITPAVAADLPTVVAAASGGRESLAFDGVVEAVRQTVIAAQVPGAVVELQVKAGDRVRAGQLLLRLDARAADQGAAASEAQVQAARASLDAATREFERQKQLLQKKYISQAALDRAEAEFKAARAQADAQIAQAAAARTQTAFHVVRAPYAGVVAEVPVALGDMAMPGRPLVTVYDPAALRVAVALPQTVAARLQPDAPARIEIPGVAGGAAITASRTRLLPTVDAGTHTAILRAELPAASGAAPGMFARVGVALAPAAAGVAALAANVTVPKQALVRRAELSALYVLDDKGRPLLRQVRLGREAGGRVEVLTGLSPGERVVTDPQAAARTLR